MGGVGDVEDAVVVAVAAAVTGWLSGVKGFTG